MIHVSLMVGWCWSIDWVICGWLWVEDCRTLEGGGQQLLADYG